MIKGKSWQQAQLDSKLRAHILNHRYEAEKQPGAGETLSSQSPPPVTQLLRGATLPKLPPNSTIKWRSNA